MPAGSALRAVLVRLLLRALLAHRLLALRLSRAGTLSLFTAAIAIIASVSAFTARETKNVPTDQLGLRAEQRVPAGV